MSPYSAAGHDNVIYNTVVLILLVLLWKYKNDAFRHYVCPCIGRGSKQAMMSLQQENQRLRQELNQTKMNSSNRFSQGHFGTPSCLVYHSPCPVVTTLRLRTKPLWFSALHIVIRLYRSRVSLWSTRWYGRNVTCTQTRGWSWLCQS